MRKGDVWLITKHQASARSEADPFDSDGFLIFLEILLNRNEEAGFEVLRFELLGRDRLPFARHQNLRIDKGIERLLQSVNFNLPFEGNHFFNDDDQRISR